MDDDEIFERSMVSLGVEPLDAAGAKGSKDRAGLLQSDLELFEATMLDLEEGDRRSVDRRSRQGPLSRARRQTVRRRRSRLASLKIEDRLDLHRLKSGEALDRLERFLAAALRTGTSTVLVITGKGHHSPGGRGVLKQRVEEWILGRGKRFVRQFSEAPRALGGRGAYVLHLRQRS